MAAKMGCLLTHTFTLLKIKASCDLGGNGLSLPKNVGPQKTSSKTGASDDSRITKLKQRQMIFCGDGKSDCFVEPC